MCWSAFEHGARGGMKHHADTTDGAVNEHRGHGGCTHSGISKERPRACTDTIVVNSSSSCGAHNKHDQAQEAHGHMSQGVRR